MKAIKMMQPCDERVFPAIEPNSLKDEKTDAGLIPIPDLLKIECGTLRCCNAISENE